MTRLCGALTCWLIAAAACAQPDSLSFVDVTDSVGLTPIVRGWTFGHCGAWGDFNGDGRPDLYLGAFADRPVYGRPDAPIPNPLMLSGADGFVLSPQEAVRFERRRARTTYAMAVDLDNDGDADLAVFTHAGKPEQQQSVVFENDGGARFTQRTPEGDWPAPLAARNVTPIDLDGDGLLDLIITDADYAKRRRGTCRVYALRQVEPWRFEDVTREYGFDLDDTPGNGLAVGDVNDDGLLDVFIADANRLYVSRPDRTYRRLEPAPFVGPLYGRRDVMTCGAALGDLTGDGLLDLVTTVHGEPGQVDVYIHRGLDDSGMPRYERVTAAVGLDRPLPRRGTTGLPITGAHVAIADFNNDGRNDVFLSMLHRDAEGRLMPVVLSNVGNDDAGVPRLSPLPFDQLEAYTSQAPVADYDGDGRLDVFFPAWFEAAPSRLLRNTTEGGRWLVVRVEGRGPALSRQGIGATVRVFEPGPGRLLGRRDIALGNGYSSGELAVAHFGLGEHTRCDVEVTWAGRRKAVAGVESGQVLRIIIK